MQQHYADLAAWLGPYRPNGYGGPHRLGRAGAIADHCPYTYGQRVQSHGYAGEHVSHGSHLNNFDVIGFRGIVTGAIGSGILIGVTDQGREWAEPWGRIDPEGTPCHDARCACCPHTGPKGRTCQPLQADQAVARRAALDMMDRHRNPRPFAPPVRLGQGQLF